jgi:hypothetical protein
MAMITSTVPAALVAAMLATASIVGSAAEAHADRGALQLIRLQLSDLEPRGLRA